MKKIISMVLVVLMLFALVSCGISRKPEDFKEAIAKKYKDDHCVSILDSERDIENVVKMLGLDPDGVTAVIYVMLKIDGDEGVGYIIYCEDSKTAKNMKADCEHLLADLGSSDIVKQSGNNIFVGSEEVWKEIRMI